MEGAEKPGLSSQRSTVNCASSSAQAVSGEEVIGRNIGNQRQAENGFENNLPEVRCFVYDNKLDPSSYDGAGLQPASEIYVNGLDLSVGFQASFA